MYSYEVHIHEKMKSKYLFKGCPIYNLFYFATQYYHSTTWDICLLQAFIRQEIMDSMQFFELFLLEVYVLPSSGQTLAPPQPHPNHPPKFISGLEAREIADGC